MKLQIAFTMMAVGAIALFAGSDAANAKEVVADGGFETSELTPSAGAQPTFGRWDSSRVVEGGRAERVESPVLSGQYAVQIDTLTSELGRSVFQDIEGASRCFTWTFNVYPGEGVNWVELIHGRGGGGVANPVTNIILTDSSIELRTWEGAVQLEEPLSPDTWHEIVVDADATNLIQTFTIDGELAAEVQAKSADYAPETIFIGDVGSLAQHGLYTYDDVSLDSRECPVDGDEPASSDDAEETPSGQPDTQDTPSSGSGPAAESDDDDDGSSFPWWLVLLIILLILAFILWLLYRRRKKSEQSGA